MVQIDQGGSPTNTLEKEVYIARPETSVSDDTTEWVDQIK
jgi:hypothetical protein